MRRFHLSCAVGAMLLAGSMAHIMAASADPENASGARANRPAPSADFGRMLERRSGTTHGATLAVSRDRHAKHQVLGRLPDQTLRFGPLVVYNNSLVCDANEPTLLDFNRTTGAGGMFEGFIDPLCANGSITGGCDPNACDPNTLTGPVYYQDSAASVAVQVNGFSFLFMSDHNTAPSFVPPDLDQDGDVDLTDFALFAPCFNQPAIGPCIPVDFDGNGTVGSADFALFSQCFAGSQNPPSGGCAFGQGGPGGNQIDIDVCFSAGTSVGGGGSLGTIIEDDFGNGPMKAVYRCVGLPPDNAPGDDALALILVEVDLESSPPTWTAERPIDSAVFSGAVLKDGVAPPDADRPFLLPGGNFGINIGAPDGTIEDLNTIMAVGGQGQQNVMRMLDASPTACMGNGNPCGTPITPDLNFFFQGTNGGGQSCVFDNCNTCPVDNTGLYFILYAAAIPGEPNDTIDDDLSTILSGAGCASLVGEIGDAQGATDVDLYKIFVTAPPPAGWRLSAFAEHLGGPPVTRGNPLIRIFDNAGVELASNDTDGRPESDPGLCPPHAGVNALAGVTLTAGGTYWVAVSGGGCDVFLPDDHLTMPCEPDPAATCNDAYDPISGTSGTPGDEGLYTLTIGVGDLSSSSEPGGMNDSIPLATPIASLPYDSGPAAFFLGDGPFSACLGDADYYTVPDAASTDGDFLDVFVESNAVDENTDAFVVIYETDADSPTAGKRLVAVNDNEAASFDSRCLVPVLADKDYHILVMGIGVNEPTNPDTRATCFRQLGGFTEYLPGMNDQMPGAGDAIPGAGGNPLTGAYRLRIDERTEGLGTGQVPPADTGPFEPNDSLAQAAANAVLTVTVNQVAPITSTAFMGDGRYGWSAGLMPVVVGDVDIFKIDGLVAGDLLDVRASATAFSTVELYSFIARAADGGASGQIIAPPIVDPLLFPMFTSHNLLTIDDPDNLYLAIVPSDSRFEIQFLGNVLPWDLTIPGTLLTGQFTGEYQIARKAWSPPPPAAPGSRLWGVFRGPSNQSVFELNPDTGAVVNSFALPPSAPVNGASTGLTYAKTPPGHTADVLYYLNMQGSPLSGSVRMWELDPNGSGILPGSPSVGTNLNSDTFITFAAGISVNDLRGGTDGLGFAGTKLWLCNQNTDKIVRWETSTRFGDGFVTFTDSPFSRQCRDGLEGSDHSNLGSGSVIWVAARENRTIVLVDVGTNGNGPNAGATLQDRLVNLGEMDDPTYLGGAGTSNTGGLAVLPQDSGALRGVPAFNLYVGNINGNVTDVLDSEDLNPGGGALVGGWLAPDFGASGYAATSPALAARPAPAGRGTQTVARPAPARP